MTPYAWRKAKDHAVHAACLAAALVAVLPLVAILGHVAARGVRAIGLAGALGVWSARALGQATCGSLMLLAIGALVGVPTGIFAGVYLAELGDGWLAKAVRFSADVLAGIPSIVVGVFVYGVVVVPMRGPSALAGGVALGVIMLPIVARTTEALLRLVPAPLREASLALGVPKWRAITSVVVRTAAPGIATGVLLALARAAGEAAPLLFTAGGGAFAATRADDPTASLSVAIYEGAASPYAEREAHAWAAALVLVALIMALTVTAKFLVRHRRERA